MNKLRGHYIGTLQLHAFIVDLSLVYYFIQTHASFTWALGAAMPLGTTFVETKKKQMAQYTWLHWGIPAYAIT